MEVKAEAEHEVDVTANDASSYHMRQARSDGRNAELAAVKRKERRTIRLTLVGPESEREHVEIWSEELKSLDAKNQESQALTTFFSEPPYPSPG